VKRTREVKKKKAFDISISIKLFASENGFLNMLRLMQKKALQLAVEAEKKVCFSLNLL
jgi:hypothetical protein